MQKSSVKLSSFDLTIVVVSLVIGMGIFRTPSEVAAKAGNTVVFFLAWAAGALVSYFGALTFAEIGSRKPATGGFYKIFSFCYSPVFAFMVNWITVISNAASTAAVAIMGTDYLAAVLGLHGQSALYLAFGSVLFLAVINLLGIRTSQSLLNTLMVVKVLFILILISCAFVPLDVFSDDTPVTVASKHGTIESFLMCFVPIFFTYGGYQQTMNFGGDVANAHRVLPLAISRGIMVVMLLYLAINFSYVHVLGLGEMSQSTTLAADMISSVFGSSAAKWVAVIMFLAVMAYVNVSILSNPRVYYAMAEDKVLPGFFLKTNKQNGVLTYGVVVFCGMILGTLWFVGSFRKILEYVMFFDSISLITAAGAIFILRNRRIGEERIDIYRVKAYPIVPIVYIVIYTAVNISVLYSNPSAFGVGMLLFLLGFPLFYLIRRII
jgi:APA family basic amino acid/polyamine antiporter